MPPIRTLRDVLPPDVSLGHGAIALAPSGEATTPAFFADRRRDVARPAAKHLRPKCRSSQKLKNKRSRMIG